MNKTSKIIIFSSVSIGVIFGALMTFFNIETSPTKEGVVSACLNYVNSAEAYLNAYIDTNSSESFIAEKESLMLQEANIASNYVQDFSDLDSGYTELAKLFDEASKIAPGKGFPSHEVSIFELIQSCDKIFKEVNK